MQFDFGNAAEEEGGAKASMGGCAEDDGFFAPGALQRTDDDVVAEEMPFHEQRRSPSAVPLWGANSEVSSSSGSSVNDLDPSDADCSMPSPSHVMLAQQSQRSHTRSAPPPAATGCGGFSMDTTPSTSMVVVGQQQRQPTPFRAPAAASATHDAFQLGSRLSGGSSSRRSSGGSVVARLASGSSGGAMQRHAHAAAPSSPATSKEVKGFKVAAHDLLTTLAKLTIQMNDSALSAQRNEERESGRFKALEHTHADAVRAIASTRAFDCFAIVAPLWKDGAEGAAVGAP